MTQIQAYESMSKEALIEHHLHTLQQHADDMDMLSKELASRKFSVPEGWQLVPIQATKEMKLAFHKANEEYQEGTNYDLLSPSHQWAAMLAAAPTAPVAAQAQWIEHCSITDIPDAVLTPSGLAIKSEQVQPGLIRFDFINADGQPDSKMLTHDQMRSRYADLFASAAAVPTDIVAAQEPLPPLNDDLIAILGRPNFMCAGIAQLLRDSGHEIKKRAENEQAAALHFLLGHYLSDPQNWNWKVAIALNPDKTTCTCPSVDGTQKWPCPVHPPEV